MRAPALLLALLASTAQAQEAARSTFRNQGPAWALPYGIWNHFEVNTGGFPHAAMFGEDNQLVPIPQALVGALNIPATAVGGNAGYADVGYGLTSSPNMGVVGSGGFGSVAGDGMQAWGANFLVSNCGTPQCAANTGHNNMTAYGLEIDTSFANLASGAAPNIAGRGLWITGDAQAQSAGPLFDAIDVGPAGVHGSPQIRWKHGFSLDDGAADQALNIGALSTFAAGVTSGSQPIMMRGYFAGVAHQSFIASDAFGNMILSPTYTQDVTLTDGNGLTVFQVGATGARGPVVKATAALVEPFSTPASSSAPCQVGQIANDAQFFYSCVQANTWRRVALSAF